jgi:hypothetical protein
MNLKYVALTNFEKGTLHVIALLASTCATCPTHCVIYRRGDPADAVCLIGNFKFVSKIESLQSESPKRTTPTRTQKIKKKNRKTEKKYRRQDRYDDHEMAKRSIIMKWD